MAQKTLFPTYGTTIQIYKSGKSPLFKLEGFERLFKGNDQDDAPAIMTGITYQDDDVLLPVVALDDEHVMYSFGKNFGHFSLTGTMYVVKCKGGISDKLKRMQNLFKQGRTSTVLRPINFSGGGFSCKVYVQSLNFNNANPAMQSFDFSLECIIAPPKNKG